MNERVKMLFLCLFLFVLIVMKNTGSATELTYIVRKEGQTLLPSCIAEGNERYEGIGWIYPLPESGKLPEEESYYLPDIKNNYNCKFSYNEHCSKIWSLRDWNIDTNTTMRYNFISDERWLEFPTYYISNETKDFQDRIEIPKIFKLGFSVRTSEQMELFICEGWDPRKYSCYYFNVTNKKIDLSRHVTMSENDVDGAAIMDSYQAFSNIIYKDEWRNFEIGVDGNGRIKLKDMNLNRTLIENVDKQPLRPAYFFFRTKKPSVWKIHQNQFFYTKRAHISRLGPKLKVNSEDLCINLYIASCSNCLMNFFTMENGTKTLIESRELKKSGEWTLVRLSKEQIEVNDLNIFVETSFKHNVTNDDGFWAIDDVRVCHKNEVKIYKLTPRIKMTEDDNEVSCQLVAKPNLRPTKKIFDQLKEFPTIESESDSSSVNLTWPSESDKGKVEYFISYQANDICMNPPFNTKRMKSNGFVVTKSNQLSLKNLVPYTSYNVTFSTMLHLTDKHFLVSTKESSYISFEEHIQRIRIEELTDTTAKITWDKVDCKNIYGHIIYSLELKDELSNNVTDLGDQSDNSKTLTELRPYTAYTLNIGVSRGNKPRNKVKKLPMKFKTKPGLASSAKNLEIYATSNTSLSLRYNIPDEQEGHPIEVHLTRCNPLTLKKCKTFQYPVMPCKLFSEKYCLDVTNLIPHQQQLIRISLKNEGSHAFGEEAIIRGYTEDHVPGKPTNITYKLVDCTASVEYCNLDISWLHPYDQNGTITSFNILLNSAEVENDEKPKATAVKEIYKIHDGHYLPQYKYQIKHVPFSQKYNLYIQSVNHELASPFTTKTVVHTADLGDQIDQNPILTRKLEDSLEFNLKPFDRRLKTTLTVMVQDFDESKKVDDKIKDQIELADNLCNEFGETWISQTLEIDENTRTITIGKSDSSGKPLRPNTEYCITFLMENEYRNTTHENVYYEKLTTLSHVEATESGNLSIFLILLIIFIILVVIAALVIWYLKKRRNSRKSRSRRVDENEDGYESLPFEDTIANNNMYDHLEHK